MSGPWMSLEITVTPEAAEAIEFALNSVDALGTSINQLRRSAADPVTVIGYFTELPESETLQDEIHYALRAYALNEDAVLSVERVAVQDADWLAEWKKHWTPTTIGRFVVAPPWIESIEPPEGGFVIRIDPNMAFGTGTHETTQLCLRFIDEYFTPGSTFLDVGTGTGILAIAAAMINGGNSERISGYDTDADSVKIARKNAELNGVGSSIEFFDGPIDEQTETAAFVCANLTIDVILPILDGLLARSEQTLVLSGILAEQEHMIATALADRGHTSPEIRRLNEWIAVRVEVAA